MQDEFNKLSKELNSYMRVGKYKEMVNVFDKMICILKNEKKYTDELKTIMFAFHVYLEVTAKINADYIEMAENVIQNEKFNEWEIEDLYFEVSAYGGPMTLFTQNESFYIFRHFISGETEKASVIIENVIQKHLRNDDCLVKYR